MESGPRCRRKSSKFKPSGLRFDFQVDAIAHARALEQLYGGLGFELYDGGLLIEAAPREVGPRREGAAPRTRTAPR